MNIKLHPDAEARLAMLLAQRENNLPLDFDPFEAEKRRTLAPLEAESPQSLRDKSPELPPESQRLV